MLRIFWEPCAIRMHAGLFPRKSNEPYLAGDEVAMRWISADGDLSYPVQWAGLIGSDPGHAFFEMSVLVVRLKLVLEGLSIRPNRARV